MATSYDNVPSWPAGHKITAAEALVVTNLLEAGGANGGLYSEQIAYKPSDTTLASTTTMTNDGSLFVPMQANGIYAFTMLLGYAADAAVKIKIGWTVPSGASIKWVSNALDSSITAATSGVIDKTWRSASTPTLGVDGASNNLEANPMGVVIMSTTPGNLQFQWAQVTSSATAVTVKGGSWLSVKRIS